MPADSAMKIAFIIAHSRNNVLVWNSLGAIFYAHRNERLWFANVSMIFLLHFASFRVKVLAMADVSALCLNLTIRMRIAGTICTIGINTRIHFALHCWETHVRHQAYENYRRLKVNRISNMDLLRPVPLRWMSAHVVLWYSRWGISTNWCKDTPHSTNKCWL